MAAGQGGSAAGVMLGRVVWGAVLVGSLACAVRRQEVEAPAAVVAVPVITPPAPPEPTPAEACLSAMDELDGLGWESDVRPRREALRARAVAAMTALPDDDPRAIEILCRASVDRVYVVQGDWRRQQELLWRRIAAIDARRPVPDRRARYASLTRDTLRLKGSYRSSDKDPLFFGPYARSTVLEESPTLDAKSCANIDHAQVRLAFAWRVGPWQAVHDELYDEIVAELGPEAPALATVLEYGASACRESRGRAACPPERRFEHALALRERTLGPEHAFTNASRLNLAMTLDMEDGPGRRVESLLRRVVASPTRDRSTILALNELGGRALVRRKWKAAAQWLVEASRLADALLDEKADRRLIAEIRYFHVHAAVRSGDYDSAEAILLRMQADSEYADDMREYTYSIAEVLRLAGRYEEAILYYDRNISAWRAYIVAMAGKHNDDGTEAVPRVLRGRAAALAALHRDEESQRDLDRAGLVEMLRIGVLTSDAYEHLAIPEWMLSKIRRRETERARRIRTGR